MANGGLCARSAISTISTELTFSTELKPENQLDQAFNKANSVVFGEHGGRGGATLSVLLVSKDDRSITIGNVGDSRVYEFCQRGSQFVEQLTIHDTIEARVAQIPQLKQDEIAPELKGRLAQYIGMSDDLQPAISRMPISRDKNKGYVLTTDGVHDISKKTLTDVILNTDDAFDLANRLLDISVWSGANDNATTIAIYPDTITQFISTKRVQKLNATFWSPIRELVIRTIESNALSAPDRESHMSLPKETPPTPKKDVAKKTKKRSNKKKT